MAIEWIALLNKARAAIGWIITLFKAVLKAVSFGLERIHARFVEICARFVEICVLLGKKIAERYIEIIIGASGLTIGGATVAIKKPGIEDIVAELTTTIDQSIGKHLDKLKLTTTLDQTVHNYLNTELTPALKQTVNDNLALHLDQSVGKHLGKLKLTTTLKQTVNDNLALHLDQSVGKHLGKLKLTTTLKQTVNDNLALHLDQSVGKHLGKLKLTTTLDQTVHNYLNTELTTTLKQTTETAVTQGFADGLAAMQKHLDRGLEQHNEKSCQFWQVIDRRVKHLECKLDKDPKGKACAAKAPKACE